MKKSQGKPENTYEMNENKNTKFKNIWDMDVYRCKH